jgi:hypothetical protein
MVPVSTCTGPEQHQQQLQHSQQMILPPLGVRVTVCMTIGAYGQHQPTSSMGICRAVTHPFLLHVRAQIRALHQFWPWQACCQNRQLAKAAAQVSGGWTAPAPPPLPPALPALQHTPHWQNPMVSYKHLLQHLL